MLNPYRDAMAERSTAGVPMGGVDPRAVERARALLALGARGIQPARYGEPTAGRDVRAPRRKLRGSSRRAGEDGRTGTRVRGGALGARVRGIRRGRRS